MGRKAIANITRQQHGNVYADEYAKTFRESIISTEGLGRTLDKVQLGTTYSTDTHLKREFYQVDQLIQAREVRKAERDIFFVDIGVCDMDINMNVSLQVKFKEIDDALL